METQSEVKEGAQVSSTMPEAWITVGRIVAAQGMNGEVRIYPDSDFPERFLVAGDRWFRRPQQQEPEKVKLVRGRYLPKKHLYVVKFKGIDYRDQAEALRDVEVLVPESDRPPMDDGEYHVMDLVGLEVFNQETGESIGHVVDLLSVGNDLLEIELPMPQPETKEVNSSAGQTINATSKDADIASDQAPEQAIKQQEKAAFTRRKGRRKAARERKKAARPTKAPRLLVPFVHDIVPIVDLETGRIEIIPPPGLLDLSH